MQLSDEAKTALSTWITWIDFSHERSTPVLLATYQKMTNYITSLMRRFNPAGAPQATEHAPDTIPTYIPRDSFNMMHLAPALDMAAMQVNPHCQTVAYILMQHRSTERNAQSSPLLRLPAEIRNAIFSYALGGYNIHFQIVREARDPLVPFQVLRMERAFDIRRPNHEAGLTSEEKSSFLNLTLASRQIYVETGMLPFIANTFVITHSEDGEKWLAQKLMSAQQDAITTVQCPVQELFFDFLAGPVASRHCTGTLRQFEGLECLVLDCEKIRLTEQEKEIVVEKLKRTSEKKELKVVFLETNN
jgi:hypothetical protein